ncbi:major facilitator superfamily MFS_1 [Streptomyces coelicoflavus ZG0656]|nr:major facilitator superfamily MFS_1 [Streptomyces coelicoflavus ZG0656]MZE49247.1 MFS transporter [Streptomyces sp. SID5477]
MTAGVETGADAKPGFSLRLASVVTHYGIVGLGYFGVMSVLVIALRDRGFAADQVALCSSVFLISSKVSKIPIAPLLDRLRPNLSLLAGCWLAGGAFAALPWAGSLRGTLTLLLVAGFGVSVNALASKQIAAEASDGVRSRTTAFATINMAVNVASAVAAPVALLVLDKGHQSVAFVGTGCAYILAGAVSAVSLRTRRPPSSTRPGWRAYLTVIRTPRLWNLLAANAFGWFLYAQLFNALPLYVTESQGAGTGLGWLLTANALLIIVFQIPLGQAIERITKGDADLVMALSFAVFGIAFLAGGALPGFAALVALIVLFSTAEAMFIPSVDVSLLAKIDASRRAAGYSVLSIATAVGETLGASAGLTVLAWMQSTGNDRLFWLTAAVAALAFAAVTFVWRRGTPTDNKESA